VGVGYGVEQDHRIALLVGFDQGRRRGTAHSMAGARGAVDDEPGREGAHIGRLRVSPRFGGRSAVEGRNGNNDPSAEVLSGMWSGFMDGDSTVE
jgi:hypothetical protein